MMMIIKQTATVAFCTVTGICILDRGPSTLFTTKTARESCLRQHLSSLSAIHQMDVVSVDRKWKILSSSASLFGFGIDRNKELEVHPY